MLVQAERRLLNLRAPGPIRFIVLCHARSGSNLVSWSLNSHEAVEEYGEVLHDSDVEARASLPERIAPYVRGSDAGRFLRDELFNPSPEPQIRAQGFKLFYDHARGSAAARAAWSYLIDDADIRVIHLVRRNLLDCLLSREVALRSGEWFRRRGEPSHAPLVAPFSLSPWGCQEFFGEITTWRMWVAEAFARHPTLTLEYERDLCADFSGAMSRVFKFIGLAPTPVTAPLVKQQSVPAPDQLLNYDELRRWFRHTLFEDFFPPVAS